MEGLFHAKDALFNGVLNRFILASDQSLGLTTITTDWSCAALRIWGSGGRRRPRISCLCHDFPFLTLELRHI
jgi:hypothetical protein